MLKIVTVPNPVLTRDTVKVKSVTPKIKRLVKEMKETLISQKDPEGVGLAAPQIGESLSLFIMKPSKADDVMVCINPEIRESHATNPVTQGKKKRAKMEGCLSIPRIWAPLKRNDKIVLKYMDLEGNTKTQSYEGFEATIVQHEVDHLKGILFTQRCLENKITLYEEDGDELVAMKA